MTTSDQLTIQSSDILRLILHHLTESGLHETARTLRQESNIGTTSTHADLASLSRIGDWGSVLTALRHLDASKFAWIGNYNTSSASASASKSKKLFQVIREIHEMAVLELADCDGDVELAGAVLRLSMEDGYNYSHYYNNDARNNNNNTNDEGDGSVKQMPVITEAMKFRLEQKMQALLALRGRSYRSDESARNKLPVDYYGENGVTRQERRDAIAKVLKECIPTAPKDRLVTLLQQAIKWQSYTGQLAFLKDVESEEVDEDILNGKDDETSTKSKIKKKRKRVAFDLELGKPFCLGKNMKAGSDARANSDHRFEKIPSRECAKIKLGKKSKVECALFLPDGSSLVTGSTDGFIEVWDSKKFKLRTDLDYQKDDDLMLHDAAVLSIAHSHDDGMLATGSADGMIRVWKVDSGKCIRQFDHAHSDAVSCLTFSNTGSQVLSASHDGLCREFGLRASKMLKEFRGHQSYVNACAYLHDGVHMISSGADGTVRVWALKSSEEKLVIRPDEHHIKSAPMIERSVHTLVVMHTPAQTFMVVPRGSVAYLMNIDGDVLRTYKNHKQEGGDFVIALVSPTNKWLYCTTEDHNVICFDILNGTTKSILQISPDHEICAMAHHPHQGMLACSTSEVSGESGKKRGVVKVWK